MGVTLESALELCTHSIWFSISNSARFQGVRTTAFHAFDAFLLGKRSGRFHQRTALFFLASCPASWSRDALSVAVLAKLQRRLRSGRREAQGRDEHLPRSGGVLRDRFRCFFLSRRQRQDRHGMCEKSTIGMENHNSAE